MAKDEKKQTVWKRVRKYFQLQDPLLWGILTIILLFGIYLRFYNIEAVVNFGWDQARDAWIVRDILHGKLVLLGPRTGIGHIHLPPLYFYSLAPFYFLSNFDPVGALYHNFFANIFNFVTLFYVTKKMWGNYSALFVTLIYATSHYIININIVPWNVTTMPGFSALIFYAIYQIYQEKYKWVFILWALCGFYFNLHFTAIYLPFIALASLIFVKQKKKVIYYSLLSIPLYLVWLTPNIIHAIQTGGGDSGLLAGFFSDYYHGFHARFFLYRLEDALVMFKVIFHSEVLQPLKYIVPALFLLFAVLEKDKQQRLLAYMISLWFIIPWVGFTLYSGPTSEYYYLYQVPMVLFMFVYIQKKLLRIHKPSVLIILIIFWSFYIFENVKGNIIKPEYGGLMKQKDETREGIQDGKKYKYNEGDIKSYLYEIWVKEKRL